MLLQNETIYQECKLSSNRAVYFSFTSDIHTILFISVFKHLGKCFIDTPLVGGRQQSPLARSGGSGAGVEEAYSVCLSFFLGLVNGSCLFIAVVFSIVRKKFFFVECFSDSPENHAPQNRDIV